MISPSDQHHTPQEVLTLTAVVESPTLPYPTYHAVQAPGSRRWHVFREAPGVVAVVHPVGFADREEVRAVIRLLAAAPHCLRCGAPCRDQFTRLDDLGTDLCLGGPGDHSTENFAAHVLPPGKGSDFV